MMPNQISLFTSLQTFNFLPGSKTNSPNSGAGKALHSALKAIALAAPASRPAYWVRKLPDKDSILVVSYATPPDPSGNYESLDRAGCGVWKRDKF